MARGRAEGAAPRGEVSAGGVVYRRRDGAPRYLLIRDAHDAWGFPKGHVEADEDARRAARREVAEETGLAAVVVEAELASIAWEFGRSGRRVAKTCHFFLMRADAGVPRPQRDEGITDCRWATFDEAMALLTWANVRDVLRAAHARLVPAAGTDG